MNAAFTPPGETAIDQLLAAMAQAGIKYDDKAPIVGDGTLHRFHVEGDAQGVKNGWYCFHDDATPAGNFGCMKRYGQDTKLPFSAKRAKPLTAQEKAELAAKMAAQQAKREAEDKAKHEAAAVLANAIWSNASQVGEASHPYLLKKGIQAHGARIGPFSVRRQQDDGTWADVLVSDNALLIPRRSHQREIVSLQAIFPNADNVLGRDRTYLANGEAQGTYETIGQPQTHEGRQVFLLCEGFATGAALHEATGHCAVVAFDAGNLIHVAKRVRAQCPEALIIMAADNDQWTTQPVDNPGLHHAKLAAKAVKGRVMWPDFPHGAGTADSDTGKVKGPTDFDDLRRLQGEDAVKAVFEACLNTPPSPNNAPQGPTPGSAAPMVPEPALTVGKGPLEQIGGESLYSQEAVQLLAHDMGVIPMGATGGFYGFWRCSTRSVELIRQGDILKKAHLFRLAGQTDWEQWCQQGPGKLDTSFIGNHLIQVCQHLGEIDVAHVPASMASPADIELALSIAWLVQLPSTGQLVAVLSQHPEWKNTGIWKNKLSYEVHCDRAPPSGGEAGAWGEGHDKQLSAWITHQWGARVSARLAAEAIELVANQRERHPVCEYLNALAWDGTPRLDTWLTTCAGVEETPYTRAVGPKTLIGAVARAMDHGCKVDTMLVLEGPQGLKKSSLIAALVPDNAWFADDLGADIGDKDAQQGLRGKWIIEFAEMANMARSEVRKVKQFLSSRVDRYRPSYGYRTQDFKRQVIFIGTINPEGGGGYLIDRTGGRRFWPVTCKRIDLARMQTERDQLWAEAVVRYRQEEPWWLDDTIEAFAREEQAARQPDNPWEERVSRFIEELPPERVGGCWSSRRATPLTVTTTGEVYQTFMGRDSCDRDMRDTKLIANVLAGLGWTQGKQTLPSGRRVKCWRAPSP